MHDAWRVWLAVAVLFALSSALLAVASRRGRLGATASLLLALAATAWAIDLTVVSTGFHDADGFVDCGRACSAWQLVTAVGFLAPPLVVSLSALGLLTAALRRRRSGE